MDNRCDAPARSGHRRGLRQIETAQLAWENGRPLATAYNDIYYSADGPKEVTRVFLTPSNLVARFKEPSPWGTGFTVAEFGFGTALNFLVTAAAWLRAPTNSGGTARQMHFISIDKHPLQREDFVAINKSRKFQHPALGALIDELCQGYPPAEPGWHRRYLANGQIMLSLFWGDVADALQDIKGRQQRAVDAWYLDGFSPSKNAAMWQPALWPQVAALSAPGTTVATFTAVGAVRRGLRDVGFAMRREIQLPHKNESLAGVFETPTTRARHQPWLPPERVNIVGAGIAGASMAHHLAQAGIRSRVFEAGTYASGTSRIPATLLHGRLLDTADPLAQQRINSFFYATAYCYARPGVSRTGAIQAAVDKPGRDRLHKLFAQLEGAEWASLLTSAELDQYTAGLHTTPLAGLLLPDAATVHPATLIQHLLAHDSIELLQQTPYPLREPPLGDTPTILTCGAAARGHPRCGFFELALVGGQLNRIQLQKPNPIPITGAHYLVADPSDPTWAYAGASYEHHPWAPQQASQYNLAALAPGYRQHHSVRALRCITSDRLPVIGKVAADAGLWVSLGHGSMGMVSAHVGAAVVSSQLAGTFAPMLAAEEAALQPQRFHARQAKRGARMGARPQTHLGHEGVLKD